MKYRTKFILAGLAGGILTLAFFIYSLSGQTPLQTLTRPQSGEGSREESLQVELLGQKYPLEIVLREMPWGEEECNRQLKAAALGLESLFLAGNPDLEHILWDVSFPAEFPDSQVSIEWYLDSWEYVDPGGTVKNEALKEPVPVKAQAVLSLEGQSLMWERTFVICPPRNPDMEQKLQMLRYQVEAAQEKNERNVQLPDSILGEEIRWFPETDRRWVQMAVLTALTLCGMAAGQRGEEEKQEKQRKRDMQRAYPDIVSRLSLYMSAGISTRKAWERIVENYERKNGKKHRPGAAYEEMCITLREMQSGVPEAIAYERFGTRCRMPSYLKLGTLLSQNLRKGTRNLSELLAEESRDAFEDRKAFARKLGEECESKLLLPMILMLLTILIMVMYPAVRSFQV